MGVRSRVKKAEVVLVIDLFPIVVVIFGCSAPLSLLLLDWEEQGSVCLTSCPNLGENGPKLTEL